MRIYKNCILILFILNIGVVSAQDWKVPKDKETKAAPFKFDDASHQRGATIFQQNCISCHGTPGKNNFVNLTPPPGDPAAEKFSKQTDGSLFFKITTGRGPMPSFKSVLTEEQRWLVISYIRSFHKAYKQPELQAATTGTYGGMQVNIDFAYDSIQKQFKAKVVGLKDGKTKPIAGIEMVLYAKRLFGRLPVDEPKTTDDNGEALFLYKDSLPGNKAGMIEFMLKANTEGLTDLEKVHQISAGKKLDKPPLTATRAMWTNALKTPLWLLFSYLIVVGTIWSILIYIIFQVVKIKRIGKKLI